MILKKNQSLLDFVVQYGGAVDEWFNVADKNNVGLTDDISPGTLLDVTAAELRVTKYFDGTVLDITTQQMNPPVPRGIGYMQIGTDFISS